MSKCPGMECPSFKLMDEQLMAADAARDDLHEAYSGEIDRLDLRIDLLRIYVERLREAAQPFMVTQRMCGSDLPDEHCIGASITLGHVRKLLQAYLGTAAEQGADFLAGTSG